MCQPDRVKLAIANKFFFELFLFNFVAQIADIDSCAIAAFVAHIFLFKCLLIRRSFVPEDSSMIHEDNRRLDCEFVESEMLLFG